MHNIKRFIGHDLNIIIFYLKGELIYFLFRFLIKFTFNISITKK